MKNRELHRVEILQILIDKRLSLSYSSSDCLPITQKRTDAKRCRKHGTDKRKSRTGRCNIIGLIYEKGQGDRQDYTKSYMWLSLVADQGLGNSTKNLDHLVNILTPS